MKYFVFLILLILPVATYGQPASPKAWNWNHHPGGFSDKDLYSTKAVEKKPVKRETCEITNLEPVKPSPPQVYIRDPIVGPDGTFNSPRFLDHNKRAGELYKVSGAAINDYTARSMLERNALERRLDLEWTNWQIKKYYYLHNTTPWKPSKKF